MEISNNSLFTFLGMNIMAFLLSTVYIVIQAFYNSFEGKEKEIIKILIDNMGIYGIIISLCGFMLLFILSQKIEEEKR